MIKPVMLNVLLSPFANESPWAPAPVVEMVPWLVIVLPLLVEKIACVPVVLMPPAGVIVRLSAPSSGCPPFRKVTMVQITLSSAWDMAAPKVLVINTGASNVVARRLRVKRATSPVALSPTGAVDLGGVCLAILKFMVFPRANDRFVLVFFNWQFSFGRAGMHQLILQVLVS